MSQLYFVGRLFDVCQWLLDLQRYVRLTANGRTLGEYQADAIRNISGSFRTRMISGSSGSNVATGSTLQSGAFHLITDNAGGGDAVQAIYGAVGGTDIGFDPSRVVPTSSENRPISTGVAPFIHV